MRLTAEEEEIKPVTSPQIWSRTTLLNLTVQLYKFAAKLFNSKYVRSFIYSKYLPQMSRSRSRLCRILYHTAMCIQMFAISMHAARMLKTVKKLLQSVHVCQSYHKNTAWVFFDSRCTKKQSPQDIFRDRGIANIQYSTANSAQSNYPHPTLKVFCGHLPHICIVASLYKV